MTGPIPRPTPAEAAQRYYQGHLIMISEFGDLAARAAAIGDTFGASRYQRHADEHMKAAWKALVHWRDCLEQQRGGRSCA